MAKVWKQTLKRDLTWNEYVKKSKAVKLTSVTAEMIEATSSVALGDRRLANLFGDVVNNVKAGTYSVPVRFIREPGVFAGEDEDPEKNPKRNLFMEFEGKAAEIMLAIDEKLKAMHHHLFKGEWNPTVKARLNEDGTPTGTVTCGANIMLNDLMRPRPLREGENPEDGPYLSSCIRLASLDVSDPAKPVFRYEDTTWRDIQAGDVGIVTLHLGSIKPSKCYALPSLNAMGNGHKWYVTNVDILKDKRPPPTEDDAVDMDDLDAGTLERIRAAQEEAKQRAEEVRRAEEEAKRREAKKEEEEKRTEAKKEKEASEGSGEESTAEPEPDSDGAAAEPEGAGSEPEPEDEESVTSSTRRRRRTGATGGRAKRARS